MASSSPGVGSEPEGWNRCRNDFPRSVTCFILRQESGLCQALYWILAPVWQRIYRGPVLRWAESTPSRSGPVRSGPAEPHSCAQRPGWGDIGPCSASGAQSRAGPGDRLAAVSSPGRKLQMWSLQRSRSLRSRSLRSRPAFTSSPQHTILDFPVCLNRPRPQREAGLMETSSLDLL